MQLTCVISKEKQLIVLGLGLAPSREVPGDGPSRYGRFITADGQPEAEKGKKTYFIGLTTNVFPFSLSLRAVHQL